MSMCKPIHRFAGAALACATALAGALHISPAFAVDQASFACNGLSGSTCSILQLDGAQAVTAAADTCVGTETGCPSEQNPVWPADWDALLFPSLTSANPAIVPTSGTPPGPWTFTLPWGGFGSFSGIFTSTSVSLGESTLLVQGSKNSNDVSTWSVRQQNSPPKDEYLAAALATYTGPPGGPYAGHQLLYFASTRSSPNGSATVGIWLFQQNVAVCASGPNSGKALCVDGTTTLAQHKIGDLFLFLTFSGSGKATIQAATWQGANGPAGFLGNAPGAIITCPTANDNACAVTNESNAITLGSPAGFQAPGVGFNVSGTAWPGFPGGVVPALQFQEGGLDLNAVFGGTPPCFSSVMLATVTSGSSPSQASMKSILLGNFNTCAIAVSKSCGNATPDVAGGTVTYTISGTVTNTGGGAVHGLSILDEFNGNAQAISGLTCSGVTNGTITGTDCSTVTLQPGGTVNYSATITTTANGGSDKVVATMGGVGGGSAQATSNTATCPSVSLSDSIGVSKTCTTSLTSTSCGLTVHVAAGGTVTNTSSQLSLSNINVYDCRGGTFTTAGDPTSCNAPGGAVLVKTIAGPLGPGGTSSYTDAFNPTSLPSDSGTNACPNGTYSDTVMVVGSCTSVFCQQSTVFNTATASCPLCPLNQ